MLKQLNQQFAIKDKVEFISGVNQQVAIQINTNWSKAVIYLQGAHLTSFKVIEEHSNQQSYKELIWLSPLAYYQSGKAIRGGIPICWPWFGKVADKPELPQHGFARTSLFDVKQVVEMEDGNIQIILILENTQLSENLWPFQFNLQVIFIIGRELSIELKTTNTGDKAFCISEAIHSYFKVKNIHQTQLKGLEQSRYFDQLSQTSQQQHAALDFEQEVDRIYQTDGESDCCTLTVNQKFESSNDSHETIIISQKNANSTVVWNPWTNKSRQMMDFPDQAFLEMLCVEAANTGQDILVQPGQSHSIYQVIGHQ